MVSTDPNVSKPLTPHRAFYIAEVLDMVLEQLGNDKHSLSNLAFSCKTIAEPALDHLWALNDSLEPFIPLLPKELVLDEDSVFQFDRLVLTNLPPEEWAAFDKYARRARRLYVKTVTMRPHRVYSSIYNQLIDIRPDVELFPNLTTLAVHAKSIPNPHRRTFPSSLRSLTFSWGNVMIPNVESILWTSVMNRLFLDAPCIERIHFEGSPKENLLSLSPLSFQQLHKITIKPSPLDPNVLHKYCHALSASAIRDLDLRFVRWPDSRFHPISPVFPSLRKLTVDGSISHAIEFVQLLSSPVFQELVIVSQERTGCDLNQYTQLLMLLAVKYRCVFRTLKIHQSLHCHDKADLDSFLRAVRILHDAGVDTLQLNLILGWQDPTHEVLDMVDPSKWTALKHFRIESSRRASTLWSWMVGNGNALQY